MERKAEISRKTNETDIVLSIGIDGRGTAEINTGIGFFDHMMHLFTKHGLFDLTLKATGDLNVDCHHTVEDIGIVLGQAIKAALGEKASIKRYGNSIIPMDEAMVMVVLDLSGRPFLGYDVQFTSEMVGSMETELVEEFFRAIVFNAGMNLHIKTFSGTNNHHIAEAIFKAFGRALDQATLVDGRIEGVMSTKGTLE